MRACCAATRGRSCAASTCSPSPRRCCPSSAAPSRGSPWSPSAPPRCGTSRCRPTTPSAARACSRSPSSADVHFLRGPMLGRSTAALAALCVATVASAAQPQFWRIEGARDFLEGDTEGLSVDSEGRVRLAPSARALHDPEAPSVWALARDGQGRLYAATGNDGRVFRIEGAGTGATVHDAPELEVHALALAPDGRLYAGSSPEGKVYLLDRTGKGTAFFDPDDKYIWALALDKQGRL